MVPSTKFVPWQVRMKPSAIIPVPDVGGAPRSGWLTVQLVRRPKSAQHVTFTLRGPIVLSVPVAFTPLSLKLTLQAVNRSSTF